MKNIKLNYGRKTLEAEIPERNLVAVLQPNVYIDIPDAEEEIWRAVREPINSEPLTALVKYNHRVAIMVSDITRPSPTQKLLPPILQELATVGIPDQNITVVFGVGIHRQHTWEEKRAIVGDEVYHRFLCIDSTDTEDYISYGQTSRGTPIEICRLVAQADIRICTGNIEYHYCAGYSGGAKAIMPGASSRRSIEAHHALQLSPDSEVGRLVGNPFREDIEEIGERVGIDFIVNAVLDESKEIVQVVAGDPRKAHRVGCETIDRMYKLNISEPADIVIVSAGGFPKDINVYQAQKALENAQYAVKPGGIIILVAECPEGAGEKVFASWMREANSPDEIIERFRKGFVIGGHKAAAVARVLKKAKVFFISSMPEKEAEELFFHPKASLKKALQDAIREKGLDATILVIPYGNSTLPTIRTGY